MPVWTSLKNEQDSLARIEVVSATRMTPAEFWNNSALGLSLQRMSHDKRIVSRIAAENTLGLPDVYNRRIDALDERDILVFMHDDVWVDDYFLADRLLDGLARFDIIGVAGNRRRVPNQPGWCFIDWADGKFQWDRSNLSGYVAHGKQPFIGSMALFGPAPAECELMDGLFLAARKSRLREQGVRFDPRFDFHFYDLDFCRTARQSGLKLGTWPISLTHQSGGSFGAQAWLAKYRRYLEKWEDTSQPPVWLRPEAS